MRRKQTIDAWVHPTQDDLKWAAGFLEGEGFFGTYASGSSFRVTCRQNNRWALDQLQAFFGGNISYVSQANNPHTKREGIYDWATSGTRARGIAFTLFSFLSPYRRHQIKAALARSKWGPHHFSVSA